MDGSKWWNTWEKLIGGEVDFLLVIYFFTTFVARVEGIKCGWVGLHSTERSYIHRITYWRMGKDLIHSPSLLTITTATSGLFKNKK